MLFAISRLRIKKINILTAIFFMCIIAMPFNAAFGAQWDLNEEEQKAYDASIEEWKDSDNLKGAFKGKLNLSAETAGYDKSKKEIEPIIGAIIQTALSFLGIIFIILMIYGGFLWMTAKGNEQQVEKAKELLMGAAIGLVIVTAAYAISYFVIKSFSEGVLLEAQIQ